MEQANVAIEFELDGEIVFSCGVVVNGVAYVGEYVSIALRDENGFTVEQSGVVVEVF